MNLRDVGNIMKLRKLSVAILLCTFIFSVFTVESAQSTAYTYTISVDGNWIRTQDAYIPSRLYFKNDGLANPQDIFISGDEIYIADTDNVQIVILNRKTQEKRTFKYAEFAKPNGIFVTEDKILYVADSEAQAVFIFNPDGSLKQKIGRPESVLFGKDSYYEPMKVSVSSQGNIFVVGNGAFEGIMQFDNTGVFQGYFAANKRELTVIERIEEMILSEEQINSLITKKPRPIQNIAINNRDLIYSVTQSSEGSVSEHFTVTQKTFNCIKLHNMAGNNILSTDKFMDDEWNFIDVTAGKYGNFFAITYTGVIYEYDSEGKVIFSFGGRALESDTYGLIGKASAIDIDEDGVLYVLDSEKGIVQTFVPTEFATLTHKAIDCMNGGNYTESEEIWKSLLNLNGMSRIAHVGMGRTLFRQQKYKDALEHFKFAGERTGYSDCFWELRDSFITKNMIWILLGIALVILWVLFGKRKKKPKISKNELLSNDSIGFRRFSTDIGFCTYMFSRPADGYYYLKRGIRGSTVSATVLYIIAFITFALDNMAIAFIFNTSSLSNSFFTVIALFLSAVVLWNICNYMVSTINAGEGSFKNIYIMTAYALTPYWLFTVIKVIVSYGLTNNEAFVLTILSVLGIAWSAMLVFIGLIETHNYSFKDTLKNVILTLLAMILAIVAVAIIYLIWTQLFKFIQTLIMEVTYIV